MQFPQVTGAGCSMFLPCVGFVCPPFVALVAVCKSVGEIGPQTDWLGGLASEGLTLWSKIHFSRALVPAQSALWVCHLQMQPWVVSALALVEAWPLGMPAQGPHVRGTTACQFICSLCTIWRHLARTTKQVSHKPRWLALVLGLRLLSKRYRAHQGQMLLLYVL